MRETMTDKRRQILDAALALCAEDGLQGAATARIAKAAGKYRGRAKLLNPEQLDQARELVDQGVPKSRVAARLGVHRSTLYRALAQQVSAGA